MRYDALRRGEAPCVLRRIGLHWKGEDWRTETRAANCGSADPHRGHPMEDSTDRYDLAEVRWAPRVNPHKIRRLYETDARGIVDEELIEEVGFALYSRCRSILAATEAHAGRIQCPRCGAIVAHNWDRRAVLQCGACSWRVRWGDYLKTYQDKHLHGGGAVAAFQ